MPSTPSISGEQLHALVLAADGGADDEARVLLRATLPVLVEYVAAVLAAVDDGQTAAEMSEMRSRLLAELAVRLIERRFLGQWRAVTAGKAWTYLESRVQRIASDLRDQWWVQRALSGRHPAAKTTLFARLRRLFARAAAQRKLGTYECEEAFQDFSVWLLAGGGKNLLRWDPQGGRSFDGWFHDRAINQIDTRRRSSRGAATDEFTDDLGRGEGQRFDAWIRLGEIDRWVAENCSNFQREIFLQNMVEQRSATEIAAEIGVNPGQVYMTVLRLRSALAAFQMKEG